MTPHQRQLILLIGLMSLLAGIFVFLISQSPGTVDATQGNFFNFTNTSLPYPLNESVHGLQQMYEDFNSGLSFATGEGS